DYELMQEIGRGGMGVVYRARQISLGRIVALKMILSGQFANTTEVMRFRNEAAAAAKLDHPHIVPSFDVGECDGRHYFSMGYVEGPTLDDVLKMKPLPCDSAADIVRKLAVAVSFAHQRGIIHRDLKPANILLDDKGEPRITDFGLAKLCEGEGGFTATGDIVGTPSYMTPEQAGGRINEVKETADVYALGAILYACVTGRPPFQSKSPTDTILAVLEAEATLPSSLNRETPTELESIILRCLEKKPEDRYPSAQALADDLERFLLGEPVEARHTDAWQHLRRWWRRQPTLVTHLIVIGTMMLLIQILHWSLRGSWQYMLNMTLLFAAWGGASVVFQRMLNMPRQAEAGRYLWAATDAVLLTYALFLAGAPAGGLLIGYPLLVVASGLFFRVRLVLFMLAACLVGYGMLVYFLPSERTPIYLPIYYAVGLLALGLVSAYQVHRIRVLSRYYHREIG
ncbi:MAG TPA: protein kinase, partial [Pirellulaceae bacterium]|nr:protein kinase [Pirellulaceae bacterium]